MTDTIRPAETGDIADILNVAQASGLFSSDDLGGLGDMLTASLQGELGDEHQWIVDESGGICGAAYYAPEMMANGTWNLYFIAVSRDVQGQGVGGRLLHYVEQDLKARGARLLIIETSGLPDFEATRQFYIKHGYENEARIRDFYEAGDDKIVFRKAIGS